MLLILAAGASVSLAEDAFLKRNQYDIAVPTGLPPNQALRHVDRRQVMLGQRLFFDRRLSFNGTLSCAMCHIETQAFASIQSATSVGFEGQSLRRNAPSLLNVVYQNELFHDGREPDLAAQAWSPLLSPAEMGNPSVGYTIKRILALDDYATMFKEAFGARGVDMQTVGEAFAAYQRTLLSGNSRFDRWKFGKQDGTLTEIEREGYGLFVGRARCSTCHIVGDDSALFTDFKYYATGIGYRASHRTNPDAFSVELEPGVLTHVKRSDIDSVSARPHSDLGRFEVTLNTADKWAYKTPSLRNVALTYPYMHDGSLNTLEQVVDFYDAGGIHFDGNNPLEPLALSTDEKMSLVAFLKTLTEDSLLRGPPSKNN
jgi:cytochrome c peroxidase